MHSAGGWARDIVNVCVALIGDRWRVGEQAAKQLLATAADLVAQGQEVMESSARHFAFSLSTYHHSLSPFPLREPCWEHMILTACTRSPIARTFIAALLCRLALRTTRDDDKTTLKRWIAAGLVCMPAPTTRAEDHKLVYARL